MLHSTIHTFQLFPTLDQFIWNSSKHTNCIPLFLATLTFQFFPPSSCQNNSGICSNPSANITLTHQRQLLQSNQPYKIIVDLELPESDANKQLGMFMVQVSLICKKVMYF